MSGAQYDSPSREIATSAFGSMTEGRQPTSQSTQIEQARAIAEVRAAVMIAMDRPRSRAAALGEMREVCTNPFLAERAFFRVPRGGEQVNGESIHLARELARCWGNIDYGVKELSRDDVRGQSELLAFAWDLQTNARSEVTFIIPHVKGKNNRRLTGTQEIYENNASFAGRRLRETIFAVLPVWFKAEAAEICHRTLQEGGGKPLIQRIADCVAAFASIGVTSAQIEKKMDRKVDDLTAEDVATLGVTFRSIKNGEVTKAEEFPADELPKTDKPASKLDALEQNTKREPDAKEGADQASAKSATTIADWIANTLPPALAKCETLADLEKAQQSKGYLAAKERGTDEDRAAMQRLIADVLARIEAAEPAVEFESAEDIFPGDLPSGDAA